VLFSRFRIRLRIKDENCALLLLFLSDGGPSDAHTSWSSHNWELSKLDIIQNVNTICRPFGSRLTFGTFGFAHDHETQNGKVFDVLRDMAKIAGHSCAHAVFSCGLDTGNLRQVLFSMSKALQSTRSNLSSLAGASVLRITGMPKVKRTDMVRDAGQDERFSNFFVAQNSLHRVVSRRVRLPRHEKKESVEWDRVSLMHPSAAGIRIKHGYIGTGAERAAHEMSEITIDGEVVGQNLVGKLSIHHESSQIEFHQHCALTQFEAGRLSKKFNDNIDELQRRISMALPRIEFLNVWFYQWIDPAVVGGFAACLCEKRLD
jgi:hypothetical protein